MTSPGGPTAVVADEFKTEKIAPRNAWVVKFQDPRQISRVIGKISKILPGPPHLKRCSSKRLILGFASPSSCNGSRANGSGDEPPGCFSREEIERLLARSDLDLSLFENKTIEVVQVPAVAPRTKRQAERASEWWPVNFHPDPRLESILEGSCFDGKQLEAIDRCTRVCVEVARCGGTRGTRECNGSAVVYDPKTDKIVAMAASRVDRHPMWHASVIAVDLVARIASGGAYPLMEDEKPSRGKAKYPRLRDNGRDFPLRYPAELEKLARAFPHDHPPPNYTYLCTDYWIFLLQEPCSLCAMALLHSRACNIFYGIANESHGVLGSKALLHVVPGINHRYGVWRGVRENECREAFRQMIQGAAASQ